MLRIVDQLRPSDMVRFISYVVATRNPDACWRWAGSVKKAGWGSFRLFRGPNGTMAVGRASWYLHFGEVPPGMHVLHRCDNGMCANPRHLFLGTHSRNMQDKAEKGRDRRPSASHRSMTRSGTRAQIRIKGALYRKHFPRGTDDAVIQAWLDQQWAEHGY